MDALDLIHNYSLDAAGAEILNELPRNEAKEATAESIAIYFLLQAQGLTETAEAYGFYRHGLAPVSKGRQANA